MSLIQTLQKSGLYGVMRGIWIVAIALVLAGFAGLYIGYVRRPVLPVANSPASVSSSSPNAALLAVTMRKLLDDRTTWTRMYIIDSKSNDGFATADIARLMKNQVSIGDAIKPYYGDTVGNTATNFLKQDISGLVAYVSATKAQDTTAQNNASTQWYSNLDQTAVFLAKQNPTWSSSDLRFALQSYIAMTKQEAADVFSNKYDASVADYDTIHNQILQTADTISFGIMQQFPDRF